MPPSVEIDRSLRSSGIVIRADLPICQGDLPLDSYQAELRPYAEEYLALPDRRPETVLPWLDRYVHAAQDALGPELLLLAHYYMGGEIVKLIERYGGSVADSYQLALQAARHPERKLIVESAVHFMAESIALLARPDQRVYITNPKSGCTMEMMAKDFMIAPAYTALRAVYGDDLLVVAYMNTSGRIKALAGRSGGAVCTSSNAGKIMRWALAQGRKVFFVPDLHLGHNVAAEVGIPDDRIFELAGGHEGAAFRPERLAPAERARLDRAALVLWGSFCGVHTVFTPQHVAYWKARGYRVLVHPESRREVVAAADGAGSTAQLWRAVWDLPRGTRVAVGTEGHFVRNLREQCELRGIEVVHLADMPDAASGIAGCGCATMSRNDPPHLAGLLDLLRQGRAPDANRVLAGDVVDEFTGWRERLDIDERVALARDARAALERMIEITEGPAAPRA